MFVYDGGGTLVAEYKALTGNDPAPAAQVSYLTADHLGSPRVATNQNGLSILDLRFWIWIARSQLNRTQIGRGGYFQYGSKRKSYQAVNAQLIRTVRNFLQWRHKVSSRVTRQFANAKISTDFGVHQTGKGRNGSLPTALQ